jgi:hypothetical protein
MMAESTGRRPSAKSVSSALSQMTLIVRGDGLVDFYGPRILQDYQQVARLRPGWRDVLDRWKVTLVLDRADSGVVHELGRDSAWVELYRDEVAVLLQRQGVAD